MNWAVILVIILIFRNWSGGNPISDKVSFSKWSLWVSRQDRLATQPTWVSILVFVGLPLIVVIGVTGLFADWLTVFLLHLLSFFALIYSLGDWEKLNDKIDQPISSDGSDSSRVVFEKAQELEEELLITRFKSLFSPVVWYLFLGPVGLLFYVLCTEYAQLCEGDENEVVSEKLMHYLDWVPARVTALMFSITGNFVDTFADWLNSLMNQEETIAQMMMRSARAAISVRVPDPEDSENLEDDIEVEIEELVLLLDRTAWAYVGLAAVVSIISF